jgi:predicted ribosomally synthesized peptide with nif11-like leader
MSMDDFDRLLGDLRNDPVLRSELEKLGDDPAALARWGATKGYTFTPADAARLRDGYEDEISDDDLEKVAGGWCGNDTTVG